MCTICKQNVRLFYFSAFCDIFIVGNFARKKDMLKPGCNGRFLLMFSRKIKAAALFFACVFLCSCGITRWDGFEKEDLSKYLILGEYRGLEFTEYDVSVSDSEVDEAINTALAALAGETETDSGIADALSTALFLMPQDEGQTLLTRCNAEAMWVDADGGEFFSPGFRALLRT